jgi:hypothetical protein
MTTRRELRLVLAQGRHALSAGRVKEIVPMIQARSALVAPLVELLWPVTISPLQHLVDGMAM